MNSYDSDTSETLTVASDDLELISIISYESDNVSVLDEMVSNESENYDLLSVISDDTDNLEESVFDIVSEGLTYTIEVLQTTADEQNYLCEICGSNIVKASSKDIIEHVNSHSAEPHGEHRCNTDDTFRGRFLCEKCGCLINDDIDRSEKHDSTTPCTLDYLCELCGWTPQQHDTGSIARHMKKHQDTTSNDQVCRISLFNTCPVSNSIIKAMFMDTIPGSNRLRFFITAEHHSNQQA